MAPSTFIQARQHGAGGHADTAVKFSRSADPHRAAGSLAQPSALAQRRRLVRRRLAAFVGLHQYLWRLGGGAYLVALDLDVVGERFLDLALAWPPGLFQATDSPRLKDSVISDNPRCSGRAAILVDEISTLPRARQGPQLGGYLA